MADREMDRIEKEILIRAPRTRVWNAIADRTEFGTWFGVTLPAGKFAPGETVKGQFRIKGYEHVVLDVLVVDVEPETRLSYRWHPFAIQQGVNYSSEERTLVTFTLDEVPEGTLLKVVESGFDRIPLERRAEAFRMNDGGWAAQVKNIERHVSATR